MAILYVATVADDLSTPLAIPTTAMLTRNYDWKAAVGLDVYMLGLFRKSPTDDHGDDAPTALFGHIAGVDREIRGANGRESDSILIDMHSMSGFSGAPVFLFAEPGQISDSSLAPLVGIHWGDENRTCVPVTNAHTKAIDFATSPSGISYATPSWVLIEFLESPQAVSYIRRNEDDYFKWLDALPQGTPNS